MSDGGRSGRAQRRRRLVWAGLGVLAAFVLFWVILTPAGRATVRAGLFVLDILPQGDRSPLRLVTTPPSVETVAFPYGDSQARGYLYRPADDGIHGGVVIALGYGPTWTDPLLVRVADNLARLGIAVLVPELPGLSLGYLVPEDVEALIGAFEYLSARQEVDEELVGFAGFCVGSSIALVAAEDPRITGRVAYVSVFGGYYDLRDLMRAVATHSMSYGGEEYTWHPTAQAVTMFAQNVLLYAGSADEREALKRDMSAGSVAGEPPVDLTSTGRLLHRLLTTSEPEIIDETIRALPVDILSRLDELSPSTNIERLQARVFIMHDVSDPYVPVTESQRLADALAGPRQPVYARFSLFEHVYPSQRPDHLSLAGEGFRLFIFMAKLMRTMAME